MVTFRGFILPSTPLKVIVVPEAEKNTSIAVGAKVNDGILVGASLGTALGRLLAEGEALGDPEGFSEGIMLLVGAGLTLG
jgi:hypothetical protein